jgi:serine/threonine-protein kinase
MGCVYQVVEEHLGATYALKMILLDDSATNLRQRFRQEAKAMIGLGHPNIVRFYSYGEHEGTPFFTMKFIEGGTLTRKLSAHPMTLREIVELLLKVVSAVAYLHDQGLVHRDLKPHNIFVDKLGEPFVGDFGLVKSVFTAPENDTESQTTDRSAPNAGQKVPDVLTAKGAVLGTRSYMSPEQAIGNVVEIGAKSDVWSLGVILYEALVGMRPFQHPDPAELANRIVNENPPRPSDIQKSFDRRLEKIILKCLEKKPSDRYTSRELHDGLKDWFDPPAPQVGKSLWHRVRWVSPVIAALVILVAVWIYRPQQHPSGLASAEPTVEEIRQGIRDRLAQGEKVTLIDEQGKLRVPLTSLLDGSRLKAIDEECVLDSSIPMYAQLLDDVGVPNYRFEVQVKCQTRSSRPTGGYYFADQVFEGEGIASHFFVELKYVDPWKTVEPKDTPEGPLLNKQDPVLHGVARVKPQLLDGFRDIQLRRISIPRDREPITAKYAITLQERNIQADNWQRTDWRSFSVEASPDEYRMTWEGQPLTSIRRPPPPNMTKYLLAGIGQQIEKERLLREPGGVGLVIQGGTVSFRKASIQAFGAK